jgi:hypothetical protein
VVRSSSSIPAAAGPRRRPTSTCPSRRARTCSCCWHWRTSCSPPAWSTSATWRRT